MERVKGIRHATIMLIGLVIAFEDWLKFEDIILNDNTTATNHCNIALSLFLVVDNYLFSCLVAQALTDDETKEADTWILQQIKKAILEASGISLTSQVESYNSNTTLLELAEKLLACIFKEDKKTEYALFHISISKAVLITTANTILLNVCNMLWKFLTVEILKIQEDQIKQALHYYAIKIVESELQRYLMH
ncbi:42108_t:CDS:2 [Gigaspora margarita]|uniref:42108_t:CDS:1 n=1 Tax=Gigaspora margarita TaxID=4874 RepID=A0ABN7V0R3_GIGMA|nr:42108_t:CDS:2 [Gigaspora margarita]